MRGGSVFNSILRLTALVVMFVAAPTQAADPTRPPAGRVSAGAVSEAATELRLQAIMLTPQNPHVVINGQRLKVGDRLGDIRILAIRPHSVLIDREGKHEELRLSAPIIHTSRNPS